MPSFPESVFGYDAPDSNMEAVVFRVFEVLVAFFTVNYAWEWAAYLPRLQDVVLPLGVAHYVDVTLLFDPVWARVNAALITVLTIAGFFRLNRFAYLGALLLLHLHFAARYSQGEIPHSPNVLGMLLMGFGIAAIAFEAPKIHRRFTMAFSYFFIGLGYTSAAFCKIIGTGWYWSDGRHLWMWIHEKSIDAFSNFGVLDLNVAQELALNHWWIATAFLTIGLVSEFFAVGMALRRFRMLAMGAVLGLHAGIYAIMGIIFFESTVLMIMMFLYPVLTQLDAWLPESVVQTVHRVLYPRRIRPLSTSMG